MSDEHLLELMEKINKSLLREDVQPFERVRILGGQLPKVWHRYFGGDFMASTQVLKKGAKRYRRLTATGESMEECMANLATVVADYLSP